jgi:hypothetical protein
MKPTCHFRQLKLIAVDQVPWEALPEHCQRSVQELLSLLLEDAVDRQLRQTEPTNQENEHHV